MLRPARDSSTSLKSDRAVDFDHDVSASRVCRRSTPTRSAPIARAASIASAPAAGGGLDETNRLPRATLVRHSPAAASRRPGPSTDAEPATMRRLYPMAPRNKTKTPRRPKKLVRPRIVAEGCSHLFRRASADDHVLFLPAAEAAVRARTAAPACVPRRGRPCAACAECGCTCKSGAVPPLSWAAEQARGSIQQRMPRRSSVLILTRSRLHAVKRWHHVERHQRTLDAPKPAGKASGGQGALAGSRCASAVDERVFDGKNAPPATEYQFPRKRHRTLESQQNCASVRTGHVTWISHSRAVVGRLLMLSRRPAGRLWPRSASGHRGVDLVGEQRADGEQAAERRWALTTVRDRLPSC